MPPTGNDVITRGKLRAWMQSGGALPSNALQYGGQDAPYLSISGVTRPRVGGVKAINQHDPYSFGRYNSVGTMVDAPDLSKFNVTFRERPGGMPFTHGDLDCPITFYELAGRCKTPSDFDGGWTDYVRIYPDSIVIEANDGDRTAFDQDDPLQGEISFTSPRKPYTVGSMTYATQSLGTLTGTTINDIVYGSQVTCGNCGTPNDGTKFIYAVSTGGAAAKPILYYSTDGGQTWSNASVAAAANAEVLNAVAVFGGNKLVMLSPTASSGTQGGYYVADLDPNTGIPGTPVKVTTGFVNSKQPRDMVVIGNKIYISGDGGYIYTTTSPLDGVSVSSAGGATVQNLTRIAGNDKVIVSAGASNAIIYSTNGGITWAAPANVVTGTLTAVAVVTDQVWWIGTSSGGLYYTTNQGQTAFVSKTLSGSPSAISDIFFATPEVGYVSAVVSSVAKIYATLNGGVTWTTTVERVKSLPAFAEATRLAVPYASGPTTTANNLAIAGKATGGTDGFAALGVGSFK